MTKHCFDTEVARECGVNAAIVFENLKFWIEHNEKKGKNFRDGKHWMYSTQAELSEQFDYLSVKQVRTALAKLEEAGYITKGNYNRSGYDRTTWYALTEKTVKTEVARELQDESTDPPSKKEQEPAPVAKPQSKPQSNRGKSRNHYGRKQKPAWANPEPVWLDGRAEKVVTIQDIDESTKRESLIKKMRQLASECGAVCTV